MEVFNGLDLTTKQDIVRKHAALIFASPYFHYMVRLYSWDRFFIEEYYDTEEKRVTRISIASEADMGKYLSRIKLDTSLAWA